MSNVFEIFQNFQSGFGRTARLTYPLENQSDYLGKITFGIIDDQSDEASVNVADPTGPLQLLGDAIGYTDDMTFTDYINKATEFVGSGVEKINNKLVEFNASNGINEEKGAALANQLKANATGFLEGAEGAAPVKPFALSKYAAESLVQGKKIQLYLPRAISIADTAAYDNNFELGFIGGAVEQGLKSGGTILGSVATGVGKEVSNFFNTVTGQNSGLNSTTAAILAAKVAALAPDAINGDGIQGAIKGATRTQLNPNTRALFKSVPIRNFAFSFALIPTSQAEAQEVEKIIKTFREELYPTAVQIGGIHVGYKFPNRFLIKVRYNNRDIKGIKFLPVYLQSFQAVYNSNSAGMHRDGRFNQVDISMAFTETRALSKTDITEGDY